MDLSMNNTLENQRKLNYVKWLSELQKQDLLSVGGKAANLGELYRHGFSVPNGFCVTTEAFKYFDKKIGLASQISSIMNSLDLDNHRKLLETSRTLRDFIHSHQMPTEVEKEILEAYKTLSAKDSKPAWVAVRSSATTEDLPEASFAGQFDTYLNLRGGRNIIEAVLKCWESLFTERVILYREKAGFSHVDTSMGVVIQEMVDATKSGVMFTIHPVAKDSSNILIEATIGLAEALVGGAATPDTFLVEKTTLKVLEQHGGSKKKIVLRNPVGEGVIKIETPQGQERKPCLTTEEIRSIAKLGREIEAVYNNTPQDIEWAISDDHIYILQARPITGLVEKGM